MVSTVALDFSDHSSCPTTTCAEKGSERAGAAVKDESREPYFYGAVFVHNFIT